MTDAWSKWWDIAWYVLSADATLCRMACCAACLLSSYSPVQSGMQAAQRGCDGKYDGKGVDPLDCSSWSQYSTACSLRNIKACPVRRLKSDASNYLHYCHIVFNADTNRYIILLLLLLLLLLCWCVFQQWMSVWQRADGAKFWRSECQLLTRSWRAFNMVLATFCSVWTDRNYSFSLRPSVIGTVLFPTAEITGNTWGAGCAPVMVLPAELCDTVHSCSQCGRGRC